MNTVTADNSLQQSLMSTGGLTEVRDTQGALLGFFSPVSQELAGTYVQAAAHFDAAELARRKNSKEPGVTTGEVLKRIAEQDK